jgi:O-acetyl-ADP-ribose deacetylase (regulator of RNase III)
MHVVYGMEMAQQIKTFTCKNPKIVVVLDDIYNRRGKNADLTIVGEGEQLKLKNLDLQPCFLVGAMNLNENSIMVKTPAFARIFASFGGCDDNSATTIIDGETFIIRDVHTHVKRKTFDNRLLIIKEPFFLREPFDRYTYHKTLNEFASRYSNALATAEYTGTKALQEALKDLRLCYLSVLQNMYGSSKSLAFPQLGVALGLPAYSAADVAVKSVLEFMANDEHKDAYDLIEFVVNRKEDFNIYTSLLRDLVGCEEGSEELSPYESV